ncbi:Gfo/Idh/MocA family oxidoreductase [Paenibacillus sp. MWE-103]|uniref:Gfo/Idh/MocA family oxidoreductase n=1 Tax=Paenibacillus artemisiicola TaxID=1172618 RepID=A0ABS3W4F1_9BACL|nr:Gfo/Idh/MocA family oxidoreductase [Paenibacillus artemisiicola]MBO7743159.1 Gfo/Idh/MocA family oxidoreductase [Paenibacillus artemisiicola]
MNAEHQPIEVIIVGAGSRSMNYASYALRHPDQMRVVGVVDPDANRRAHTAERYGLAENMRFASVEELVARPRLADAAINGTLDAQHVSTSLPLLRKGYDVLLEKPIGIAEEEVLALYRTARAYGRKVMICHVLRYAPFYVELKRALEAGTIGEILHIQTEENVDYHHMATAFVRGKFSNKERGGSSFLMQKCCHDLDLITWFQAKVRPINVSSCGGRSYFRESRAPHGSGTRCLTDCAIEESCVYSAKKLYVDYPLWPVYVWPRYLDGVRLSDEEKLESLRTDNPFGRCVWRCDNDIADHQAVMMEFENGSTAVHNLVGGTAKACRTVHITGSKGEIYGELEEGFYVVRRPDLREGGVYSEQRVDIPVSRDMHGGGDHRLVEDFVRAVRGDASAQFSTSLEHSIVGHLVGFRADASMAAGQTLSFDWSEGIK